MDPTSPDKSTVCSVLLHQARRAVEGCPEQEAASHSGPDDTATIMGNIHKWITEILDHLSEAV